MSGTGEGESGMCRYCSIALEPRIERALRVTQEGLKQMTDAFLPERYELHMTFLFFGKDFMLTKEQRQMIVNRLLEIPADQRVLRPVGARVMSVQDGRAVVAIAFGENPALTKLKKELGEMLGVRDRFPGFLPHVTIGKLRKWYTGRELPSMDRMFGENDLSFTVESIRFHRQR